MDPTTAMIVVRGTLSLLLVCGGIGALIMGWRLYMKGIGLSPDNSTVETEVGTLNINMSLKNVGATVMATSVAWGVVAYMSLPTYQNDRDLVRIGNALEEAKEAMANAEEAIIHAEEAVEASYAMEEADATEEEAMEGEEAAESEGDG